MDTKVLLAGIIGFILGGLLVAVAATTFENDTLQQPTRQTQQHE